MNPRNVEANWLGLWSTPLQRLSTLVFAPPLHWLSRLADHMARRPRCLVRAKSVSWVASAVVNTSQAMSFWPIIGVTPTIILDTFNLTRSVPQEQIVKAFTLGAGDFDVAYRVILRQIAPRVLNSIRLNLKAVMLFLFAGEMIASTDGLAYRIALLRRHMGMDVIIPYVLWVALLLFLVDVAMRLINRKLHPWFREA